MEATFYTYCAWAGGVLIVLQVGLQLFGIFDGDADINTDVDTDGLGDTDGHGDLFFGILSFKALTAFTAFFGLTGLSLMDGDTTRAARISISIGVGFISMLIIAWLMRGLHRLGSDGSVNVQRALGRAGTVYLRIPGAGSGRGKVTMELGGRTMELEAFTDESEIATGERVSVVAVDDGGVVKVARA